MGWSICTQVTTTGGLTTIMPWQAKLTSTYCCTTAIYKRTFVDEYVSQPKQFNSLELLQSPLRLERIAASLLAVPTHVPLAFDKA